MSSRVRASAVAVTARRGTWGKTSASRPSMRYSGRKSWPHWLTQCASSIATRASGRRDSRSSIAGLHQAFGRQVEQVQRRLRRSAARCRRAGSGSVLESSLSAATPDCCSAATWSAISAISGEMTRPRPGRTQRRDLVAQALAAAGRQHGQRAAPGQHLADHAGLQAAEVRMPERARRTARAASSSVPALGSAYED